MVQLFEQDIKTNDRQSSKGNQLKWCRNNVWYKADYMGYEGLVEYVVSRLLEKSSLKQEEYAEEKYHLCPIFDNGAGLLSDIQMDYPMEENINNLMEEARSKTLCEDFDEQIEIAEELYGQQISLEFTEKDVKEILNMESYYPQEYKKRVFEIIMSRRRKYRYLF